MDATRRRLLAAVAASATVAGCAGGGTNTDTASPTDGAGSTPTDGTTTSGGPGTATVQVRSHETLGDVLVDANGMTLYMFDTDTRDSGESTCSGGCASTWPPLTVDGEPTAGDAVRASLSTFERSSGETQVAAAGWPLYGYGPDSDPGDAVGQGVGDVWWVLAPDGTPKRDSADTATPTETPAGTPTETPTATPTETPTGTATEDPY